MSVTLDGDVGIEIPSLDLDGLKSGLDNWHAELRETTVTARVDSVAKIKIEFRFWGINESAYGVNSAMRRVSWDSLKLEDEPSLKKELKELIHKVDRFKSEFDSCRFFSENTTKFFAVCNFYAYDSKGACLAHGSWSQEWERGIIFLENS